MNLTVRNRIIASFTVIIAILLLLASITYLRLMQVKEEADGILNESVPGAYYISKMRTSGPATCSTRAACC